MPLIAKIIKQQLRCEEKSPCGELGTGDELSDRDRDAIFNAKTGLESTPALFNFKTLGERARKSLCKASEGG